AVRIVSVNLLPGLQTARVLINGSVGKNAVLLGSQDLKTWTVLTNFTFSSNRYEYLDAQAGQAPWKFYKLGLPAIGVGEMTQSSSGQFTIAIEASSVPLNAYEGLKALIRASIDLQSWVPFSTNAITNGKILLSDPDASRTPYRFFQAELLP